MKIEKPILAIDYGLKRIGLAISDSKGITSAPLKVITVTKRRKMERAIDDILLEIETAALLIWLVIPNTSSLGNLLVSWYISVTNFTLSFHTSKFL